MSVMADPTVPSDPHPAETATAAPAAPVVEDHLRGWRRNKAAFIWEGEPGDTRTLTYADMLAEVQRFANALKSLGVQRGDRVAIVMPQRIETVVAHMAVYQLGAIAMPLSMLFGPEALEYRLQDSATGVAICDESSIDNLLQVRSACPWPNSVVIPPNAR